MDPKIRIEIDDLEALSEDLERALAPATAEGADRSQGAWTDGFRASGSKHAMM
ncbi:MAG TPA: hypothetical protein VKB65_01290 [Myxococcota bacterium]|nr:hypothetical protein [Myxococcota bacterium]